MFAGSTKNTNKSLELRSFELRIQGFWHERRAIEEFGEYLNCRMRVTILFTYSPRSPILCIARGQQCSSYEHLRLAFPGDHARVHLSAAGHICTRTFPPSN